MQRKIIVAALCGFLLMTLSSCVGLQQKKPHKKQSAEAYYNLGIGYLSEGNYQAALVELRKAVSLDPKNGEIQNALGLVHFYTGHYDKAEAAYRKALSLKKDYSQARMNLGAMFAKQNRCPEAIEEFRKALNNPFYDTPALALQNIGLCQQVLGKTDDAESSFKDALSLDPLLAAAYFDLWKLYYQANKMPEAIGILNQALEQYSKEAKKGGEDYHQILANIHYGLGLSYFKNADGRNALENFRAAKQLSGGGPLSEDAAKYIDLLE
jgi:type IV pilus assembly protein PilF